ncbi:hypothetical protein BQ8420_11925 [Nocardiopsis sp. JB363]|nr:hypothetical protein BQ8420_11925 [Nocardiopsis sp. JB363]
MAPDGGGRNGRTGRSAVSSSGHGSTSPAGAAPGPARSMARWSLLDQRWNHGGVGRTSAGTISVSGRIRVEEWAHCAGSLICRRAVAVPASARSTTVT